MSVLQCSPLFSFISLLIQAEEGHRHTLSPSNEAIIFITKKVNHKMCKQKCKATLRTGEPCKKLAMLEGYCLVHWKIENGMHRKKSKGLNNPYLQQDFMEGGGCV